MTTKQTIGTIFFLALTYVICRADSGTASWYGSECRGRLMANRKPFNPSALTAASYRYPLGTRLLVTYRNKSCTVFVTDRGPARRLRRAIDLSEAAFKQLADTRLGLIPVNIEQL